MTSITPTKPTPATEPAVKPGATAPATASPPPATAPAASRSLSPPRTSDRFFIVGRTGTGKSFLARRILEASPPPRLLIDVKGDAATAYAVTFSDPGRLPPAPAARFLPRDPDDLDAYDRLYREVWEAGPRVVWLDDGNAAAPAAGAPRGLLRVVRQGRARGIGHIFTTQRPVEVARPVLTEAEHVVMFPTQHPDDIRTLAGVAGLAPLEVAAAMRRCAPFGFCWYSVRDSMLAICPPLARGREVTG